VRLSGRKKEKQLPAGPDQQKQRLVKRLTDLGYAVEIKPLSA
jgi:hypothetical protein